MHARIGLVLGSIGVALAGCSLAGAPREGAGVADYAAETGYAYAADPSPRGHAGYGGEALLEAPPAPPSDDAYDAAPGDEAVDADGALPEATPARPERVVPRRRPQARQLTAGEHRDLDNWQEFRGREDIMRWARSWGFDTARRIPVVVSADGAPVVDAKVKLLSSSERILWESRTDNHGRAELFPDLFKGPQGPGTDLAQAALVVEAGAARSFLPLPASDGSLVEVELEDAPAPQRGLDLMLMVDATGSMADELGYLQSELTDVLARVQSRQRQSLRLRTSVGVYRDHGDEYVVRSFPFTEDVAQAQRKLDEQHAAGGGDMPEAVDEALETAVTQRRWSDSARARILFLVLDAPPHPGSPANGRLRQAARLAASKGIRIIPVVASGSDKRNEGLLRSLAVTTGGTFTFLTDHSGIGNRHLAPSVSEVKVELLSDMLVRLIDDAVRQVGQAPARPTAAF